MIQKSISVLLTVFLLFSSCAEEKVQTVKEVEVTTDTISPEAMADMGSVRVNIPSPNELSEELKTAGITYNKEMMLSPSKASGYNTHAKEALAMGVYGADLGYASVYNQSQDVLSYLAPVNKFANDLGIASAFDETFAKGISANIGNKDSVKFYFTQAFDKAERNLRSDERVSVTALIITGGWIEGLYTATKLVGDKPRDEKTEALYTRIWDHLYSFNYVFDLLENYKANPDCKKLLEDLKPTRDALTKYHDKQKLTNEDVKNLSEVITPARNLITS